MELVIYCDSPPPEKRSWASSQFSDRKEWSWISELVTTWFCYSNGIRKELNLSIIVNDIQIKMIGSELRYLAPSQRTALSIISKAYQGFT
ncbi:MAG: hypothetical protein ACW99A_10850, partial [Candidatus Kariarchaeaceae archaeon]